MANLAANASGKIRGKFKIPANIPAGSKAVSFIGAGGGKGDAVFVGQGSLTTQTLRQVTQITQWWWDPLAQTFSLEKSAYIAGVDLWFTAKQTEVRIQLREVSNGVPTRTVLAETALAPEDIVVTGGGHTRALFPAPVYLEALAEYAIVILCDDPVTKLAVAEMGKFDSRRQQYVTQQPYSVGVLLSSSNASSWTPHQELDLAFRLLEAEFDAAEDTVVNLGKVSVENATDLLLYSVTDIPSANCRVELELELPDGTVQTVAPGQAIGLSEAVTGQIGVKAWLYGDVSTSAVLYPGTQLLVGTVGLTADYYTRSVVASGATKATLIYDAIVPSGASVMPQIQIDGGEWLALDGAGTTQGDDGLVEFRFTKELSGASLVKVRFTLNGTLSARPIVRDIRLLTNG